jgi:membrane associated rhomboid family serine protease
MGLHNRPYWKDGDGGGNAGGDFRPPGAGGLTIGMPKPGKVIKALLLINIVVFVVQAMIEGSGSRGPMTSALGATVAGWWQIWRYFTFQFLHGGYWHIVMNMLGLYMLGTPLERHWGSKRFLRFYLSCGVVAGVAYVVIGLLKGLDPAMPIVGASGGVFGILLACAVLFPDFRLIFFLFPVPIRLAALLVFGGMIILMLQWIPRGGGPPPEFWSHVAHLGGAFAAAVWVWLVPRAQRVGQRTRRHVQQGAWRRKMEKRVSDQAEVDRVLDKVHQEGIGSLTGRERDILQDATRRQREQERDLYRP